MAIKSFQGSDNLPSQLSPSNYFTFAISQDTCPFPSEMAFVPWILQECIAVVIGSLTPPWASKFLNSKKGMDYSLIVVI